MKSPLLILASLLASTALCQEQTTVTFKFHNYIIPYLTVEAQRLAFAQAAAGLGVDSQDFLPNTTTGDITFNVSTGAAQTIAQRVCTEETNPNNNLMCQLESIVDATGNTLCDNLNLCNITIETPEVPVTFKFHNYVLPYLLIEENQQNFIGSAFRLGVDSILFNTNTTTGDVTFYVTPTGASNIQKSVCLAKTNPNNPYLCQLESIVDATGNTLCDNLNLCNIDIEDPEVPVTFKFHNYVLPYLLIEENQQSFIGSAFKLGVDSILFNTNTTTGDVTFYVTPTGASNIQKSVCLAKTNPNNPYLCQLESITDASGKTLCSNLNLCNITIENPEVPVTFKFHNFVLPFLNMPENQQSFIGSAFRLGVDSIHFTPDTTTGDVTFNVTPTGASNVQKSVCLAKTNPNNPYLCQLKAVTDASGNTLCDNLNLCNIEIETPNIPVTFGFRKNILIELDNNPTKQQEFIMAAFMVGVDSMDFSANKATGEITFKVTSTAAANVEESICKKGKGSGDFCFLSHLKDASGKTLCGDLNPCNISFEEQPAQVVTIAINFEGAPFDFDALYAAVGRLQSAGGSSASTAAPEVVKIVLDETGNYFKTVVVNVELPFNSGSSPLLTAICSDSPLISHSLFCNIESITLAGSNTSLCPTDKLNLCVNDKPLEPDFSPRAQMSGLVLLFVLAMLLLF